MFAHNSFDKLFHRRQDFTEKKLLGAPAPFIVIYL